MRVIIAGAGPAGMVAARNLIDRGHEVIVLEKRDVPGGKVSAWQDADGDWIESGLHVFFGAYHHLLGFLDRYGLGDTFNWKPAEMIFASERHGLAGISFVPWLPTPLNGLAGVAKFKPLTLGDKVRMGLGLIRPIFGDQSYVDQQDNESYASWHLRHGMGQRSLDEVMHTMALALNFQRADKVSAKLALTAMLHFAHEKNAPKMALVKGSPDINIWRPLIAQIEQLGGRVELGRKVTSIDYDAETNRVMGFVLDDGSTITGDVYISAMPVHNLRKIIPDRLREYDYFANLKHLKGSPVITLQLFFDRRIAGVDNLLFSAGTHLSVYADMAMVAPEYHNGGKSIMQFVVAPAEDLIKLPDDELVQFVMEEFRRLHPIAREAKLLKHTIVRIPNSVYQALPGVDKYRPDQATPVSNFFLAGDYTRQHFLASIEGATISAEQCVERIMTAINNGTLNPEHEAIAAD
ncbi:FAD-dependent oxidoreductase [Candidatus Chloroploca asiatica]|uniref:Carotene 7,8-desaturase n=1 Tax=Candidatus Chloroploca asiatica TaxID=1506545 RepID=A0A2H3KP76_9CHLR|nr:FAD-dependent oxidoreductase [Candidatus Chloroploca asiatica]PDV96946.1 carotene 7,8-desaturase [Candidatus Chloroploca asiatica]